MRRFYKLLLLISTIFVFHVCDNRDATNPEVDAKNATLELTENSGNLTISLSDDVQTKTIKANAVDEDGGELKKVDIFYKITAGEDIGSLNKTTEVTDSTITLNINLSNSSNNSDEPHVVKIVGLIITGTDEDGEYKFGDSDTITFDEETISQLSMREINSDYIIALTYQNQEKIIKTTAINASGGQLNNIGIEYSILGEGSQFAFLSESEAITDSTITLTINVEENPENVHPIMVMVEGRIKENHSEKDTLIFTEQSITELQLSETSGDYNLDLSYSDQVKTLRAIPLDESNTFVSGINIEYRVLNDGPGFLSEDVAVSDTTISLTVNLTEENITGFEEHIVAVEASVESNNSVKDTIYFYLSELGGSNGGLSIYIDNDTIPYINEFGNSIEHATVSASLLDSLGSPISGDWIIFESIIDSADSWIPFGTMTPEMALTNEIGIAQSIFQSATKTGFGRIIAKTLDGMSDTTIVYVSPSEAITLEILPPSPDNEISVMGGGNLESAQITAEVRDGNGNLVNTEYLIKFTVPCDYPIDGGFCPIGDGDFSNDVKINGIIVDAANPHEPTDVVTTVNGQASITLNSGNVPGSIKLRAELFNIDADTEIDTPIAIAEETPLTIVTGPPAFGVIGYAFVDADTIGGGLFNMPVSVMLWDIWSNPVADCTNVWFSIDPPEAGVIIGESKTGNNNPDTGNSYPGVAWTTMQWSSMQVFEMPFINAQTYGIDQIGNPIQLTISSEDNIIAYQNPLEGASLSIQPTSPTVTDYCMTNDAAFQVTVVGTLRGPYGVPISGGQIQMTIYDAIAFNYIADPNGQGQGGILASQTQISDSNGLVGWIIEFPNNNCYNTNPDDEDEFDCAAPTLLANLYDPNNAASEEISVTLIKSCQP